MDEYWAQQLTIAAIHRGELKTVEDCIKYEEKLIKEHQISHVVFPTGGQCIIEVPNSLENRFDIDVDGLKNQIVEAVHILLDQLGKGPNCNQVANECRIKKDLCQEIIDNLVAEKSLDAVKIGRGFIYMPAETQEPSNKQSELSEELMSMPIEQVEQMLEDFANRVIDVGDSNTGEVYKPPADEIALFLGRGTVVNPWGAHDETIRRLMDQLNLSPGERFELQSVYRGKADGLVEELGKRYMRLKHGK